jgi:hypothetical protein
MASGIFLTIQLLPIAGIYGIHASGDTTSLRLANGYKALCPQTRDDIQRTGVPSMLEVAA